MEKPHLIRVGNQFINPAHIVHAEGQGKSFVVTLAVPLPDGRAHLTFTGEEAAGVFNALIALSTPIDAPGGKYKPSDRQGGA